MLWFHSRARGPAARARTATGLIAAVASVCPSFATGQTAEPVLVHGAASTASVLPQLLGDARPPVRFSFDATSRLASILDEGAPGDVFVAADRTWMSWLEERGGIEPGSTRIVATNRLVVAGRAGTDAQVQSLADLERLPPRAVALAGEVVPAGRYAEAALRSAGVWNQLGDQILRGASARATAEWVATGEVAVGLLYRSDVAADPRLEELVLVPETLHPPIEYLAAVLASSNQPDAARAVIDRLTSEEAASIWRTRGFGSAEAVDAVYQDADPSAATLSLSAAVGRSLGVGLLATLLGLFPALGLGWLLARRDFPGKSLVSTLTLVPLVVPPVVTGFLLLWLLGARSPLGRALTAAGIHVPFTVLGAVVAAAVVGFPLYVLTIRAAFESVDRRYEDLAATLGDSPRRRFMRISLPLALPGIAAAAVLAFARGLGEFGATIVLAGNLEGSTRTIPLAVYTLLESPTGRTQVWTLVGASIGLCLIALIGYEVLSKRLRSTAGEWRG
jgi:molybdate transport system permease protein